MLEIIHDIAPGAELAFSSGNSSSLAIAKSILWLANEAFNGWGADVIMDDLVFFSQPVCNRRRDHSPPRRGQSLRKVG